MGRRRAMTLLEWLLLIALIAAVVRFAHMLFAWLHDGVILTPW
jgi:hypothetical protein